MWSKKGSNVWVEGLIINCRGMQFGNSEYTEILNLNGPVSVTYFINIKKTSCRATRGN